MLYHLANLCNLDQSTRIQTNGNERSHVSRGYNTYGNKKWLTKTVIVAVGFNPRRVLVILSILHGATFSQAIASTYDDSHPNPR